MWKWTFQFAGKSKVVVVCERERSSLIEQALLEETGLINLPTAEGEMWVNMAHVKAVFKEKK
jgi:hypothetical protein